MYLTIPPHVRAILNAIDAAGLFETAAQAVLRDWGTKDSDEAFLDLYVVLTKADHLSILRALDRFGEDDCSALVDALVVIHHNRAKAGETRDAVV